MKAHLSRSRLAVAVLFLFFLTVTDASADSLTFSHVLGGPVPATTDLFSNPGITFTTNQSSLIFLVRTNGTLPPGASDTLRVTLSWVGESGLISVVKDIPLPNPDFPGDKIDDTVRFAEFAVPLSYQVTSFSLTVDILGTSGDFIIPSGPNAGQRVDSYTYNFNAVQPVPEPATIILLSMGLAGIAARTRRRRS